MAVLLGAGVLLVTGCAAAPDASAARDVAVQFQEAAAGGDFDAACELLIPTARDELESTTGMDCADALESLELPQGGEVREVKAYGRTAQVRLEQDTLFLALEPEGWLVIGAGCTPVPDRPYDCDVKVG
jgi:hypothetical protein